MEKSNDIPKNVIPKKSDSASKSARGIISDIFGSSFVEIGSFVGKVEQNAVVPCGIVTGYGSCNGRLVFVFAQDEENDGGAITEAAASKVTRIVDMAKRSGAPLLGILSSKGGKVSDGAGILVGFGKMMKSLREAQGIIPTIAMVTGYCTGGMAAIASLFNITIGVENEKFYISSPNALKNEDACGLFDKEILGTVKAASLLGGVSICCESVKSACESFEKLLSYLPSVCGDFVVDSDKTDDENRETEEIGRKIDSADYSAAEIAGILSDDAEYFELGGEYAPEMFTAFSRLGGIAVGIVANNPSAGGNVLTSDAAKKAADFVALCDLMGLPVVTLADVAGFDCSIKSELSPMAEAVAGLAASYIDADVAKITVVMRKAYGNAYTVMGSSSVGADICYALECSEIGTLSPETAAQFFCSDRINSSDDPDSARKAAECSWREVNTDIGVAAASGTVDDIIPPAELRMRIIAGLYMLTFNN